jgi:hypothetical protein
MSYVGAQWKKLVHGGWDCTVSARFHEPLLVPNWEN